jgi:hypothetical protein
MNPDNDAGLHPCFWESEPGEEECLEPNAAGSFWCARHTHLAFTVGDPAGDAWGIRHGFPPPPPRQSEIANRESQIASGVRAGSRDHLWAQLAELARPQSEIANRESQIPYLPSPGSGEGHGVRGPSQSEIASRESQIASGVKAAADDLPTDSRPPADDLPTDSRRPVDDLSTACPGAVSAVEPADTASNTFKQSKRRNRPTPPVAPRCTATTILGQPCRAFARRPPRNSEPGTQRSLCIYHDPSFAEDLRTNGEKGGRAYVKSHFGPPDPLDEIMSLPLDLSTRGSVQAAIDGILRMHLSGQISPRRSGPILQLLNLAMRNVTASPSAVAFADSYNRATPQFLHTSKRAIQHIANEDLRQRVNEISDIKSTRQAFLQANDEFGYPYRVEKYR